MCGIAGFNWHDPAVAQRMARVLHHRGPDDEGVFSDEHVSLAHRRLAILDLSDKGHQPMEYMGLVITYNGEVYNWRQLRQELQAHGYLFNSGTDTEVVVAAYHRWADGCVQRFNGMWAFCIYDRHRRRLFLSRDRFGIKPLYYYWDGRRLVFASELKSILVHDLDRTISGQAVNFFFYQKYIGRHLTIFERVYKLLPGHNLVLDLTNPGIEVRPYWDLPGEIDACRSIPIRQRLEMVEQILEDAVETRLVADVPVGSFLSGGVDSSLISAIISHRHRNFRTFSIGFRDTSYSELRWSRYVARRLGTDHSYDIMDLDEQAIRAVLDCMDEPFGDASVFPTYLLSAIAKRRVTVCLSGDGGDEVFAGYDTYKAYTVADLLDGWCARMLRPLVDLLPESDRKMTLTFKAKRFFRDLGQPVLARHMDWMGTFTDPARRQLLGAMFVPSGALVELPQRPDLLGLQLLDILYYLPEDILKKVDLASMLHSLEVRIPLLDYRLVPLVLSLPCRYRLKGLQTKRLLKRIARRYLPPLVVHRPKRGFTSPISGWIRSGGWIRQCISSQDHLAHGILDKAMVRRMLDEHMAGTRNWARQLWLVFVFNYWASGQFAGRVR